MERTLRFLYSQTKISIIVADGSSGSTAYKNSEICKRISSSIFYFCMPQADNLPGKFKNDYAHRYIKALSHVDTPYVAFCADDELLLTSFAQRCVDFLNNNLDYIACHGSYLGFAESSTGGLDITTIVYDAPSIDGSEISTRLMQLYSEYEATFYAIYRTEIQKKIFEYMPVGEPMLMGETTQSAASVILGKVKRLEGVYYLRNLTIAPHARDIDGWNQWMANDFSEFFEYYIKHRERMLSLLRSQNEIKIDAVRIGRALDMTFLIYVGREFHLGFWHEEYLRKLIDNENERSNMRLRLQGSSAQFGHQPISISEQIPGVARRIARRIISSRTVRALLNQFLEILVIKINRLIRFKKPFKDNLSISHEIYRFPHIKISTSVWERFSLEEWNKIGPIITKFVK